MMSRRLFCRVAGQLDEDFDAVLYYEGGRHGGGRPPNVTPPIPAEGSEAGGLRVGLGDVCVGVDLKGVSVVVGEQGVCKVADRVCENVWGEVADA